MSFNTGKKRLFSKYNRFARLYAKMLMNGKVDYRQLVNVYDRSEQQPEIKAKKLLRLERIQDVVTDEILKIYESNGITPDFILKKRLEVLNTALSEDKKDLTNANKVLESFESKLIETKKDVSTTETQQISFVSMLPEGQQVKQIAKREVKKLDNGKKIRVNTNEECENSANNDNEVPTSELISDIIENDSNIDAQNKLKTNKDDENTEEIELSEDND